MSILDRAFAKVSKVGADLAAEDAQMARLYPNIVELLTATPLVGKERRVTATLTIVCEDGQWKAGIRDRTHSVSLWRAGETFSDALGSIEEALNAPTIDWKRSGDAYARNRK